MFWMILMFFLSISSYDDAGDMFKGFIFTVAIIDAFIELMGITYFIYTFMMV